MMEKIEFREILIRLNDNAMGRVKMTKEEIMSAKILLGKRLPDLKALEVELTGENGGPLKVVNRIELVPMTNGNSANPTTSKTDTDL